MIRHAYVLGLSIAISWQKTAGKSGRLLRKSDLIKDLNAIILIFLEESMTTSIDRVRRRKEIVY